MKTKHPFLTDEEISLILKGLIEKKRLIQDNINILKELIIPPEREKALSEDANSYQDAVNSLNLNKQLLMKNKKQIIICYDAIEVLQNEPSLFGFDPINGKPIDKLFLIKLLFVQFLRPVFQKQKVWFW